MQLKLERFGLPNKPSETPEQLEELVRCGDWGRGLPFPLPLIRRQPLSPARRRTAPLTQGSQGGCSPSTQISQIKKEHGRALFC